MEYALRPGMQLGLRTSKLCLNPCCNGICSKTEQERIGKAVPLAVLILVVMEYALRHHALFRELRWHDWVLILVVMEYALRLRDPKTNEPIVKES